MTISVKYSKNAEKNASCLQKYNVINNLKYYFKWLSNQQYIMNTVYLATYVTSNLHLNVTFEIHKFI